MKFLLNFGGNNRVGRLNGTSEMWGHHNLSQPQGVNQQASQQPQAQQSQQQPQSQQPPHGQMAMNKMSGTRRLRRIKKLNDPFFHLFVFFQSNHKTFCVFFFHSLQTLCCHSNKMLKSIINQKIYHSQNQPDGKSHHHRHNVAIYQIMTMEHRYGDNSNSNPNNNRINNKLVNNNNQCHYHKIVLIACKLVSLSNDSAFGKKKETLLNETKMKKIFSQVLVAIGMIRMQQWVEMLVEM